MKYVKYKYSGIEWLSEIPEHWTTDRLKNIFSFGTGLSITKKDLLEVGIPCVNYGEIHSKYGFEVNPEIHSLKCVPEECLTTSKKSLLKKGDFVFADTSEDIEGSGNFTYLNSSKKAFAGYHTIAAKPKRNLSHRYVAYLFDSLSFRNQFKSNVVGIKVYSITQGLLNRLKIYFPTNQEQTTIAKYLDAKTQAIDKKINLLTKKADYYKELRKSIINDAVCKGLDKNVKLKESGIEWIGQMPEHWKVKRLKDVVLINRKTLDEKTAPTYQFKYIDIGNVGSTGSLENIEIVNFENAPSRARRIVKKGDVIVSTVRTYLKAIATINFEANDVVVSTGFAVLTSIPTVDANYVGYFVQSDFFVDRVIMYSSGVSYPAINATTLSTIAFLNPPLFEQTTIANYLDKKTQKIDAIVTNIGKQIETLKELRKTLISDVVTGKIKVTN